MYVVFLNGPPRSGKDSCATALQTRFTGIANMKFSDPTKSGAHAAFGLAGGINHYEHCKDTPHDDFYGITPRQAYINHSERYMKPCYGQDIFGRLFVRRTEYVRYHSKHTIVIPDSGFESESMPVLHKFNAAHCMLVRIYRPKCDYSYDSRSYLDLDVHTVVDIHNEDGLDTLAVKVIDVYSKFMQAHDQPV